MNTPTLLEQLAARIDPKEAAWFDLCDLVAERVAELLDERGSTQRELARRLEKHESYVSRLLSGGQSLTLRTLAELQVIFGEPMLYTPSQLKRLGGRAFKESVDALNAPAETQPSVQPLYERLSPATKTLDLYRLPVATC